MLRDLYDDLEVDSQVLTNLTAQARLRVAMAFLWKVVAPSGDEDLDVLSRKLTRRVLESANKTCFALWKHEQLPPWRWDVGGPGDGPYDWPGDPDVVESFLADALNDGIDPP